MFNSVNKEFLIFLFFLILSGTFWLLMTLNETYEKEIEVPVTLVEIPARNRASRRHPRTASAGSRQA